MYIKKQLKILIFFLLSFILIFIAYAVYLNKPINYENVTRRIEKNLKTEAAELVKNVQLVKNCYFNSPSLMFYSKIKQSGLFTDDNTYLIFKKDSIVFWSNNFFPIDDFEKSAFTKSKIIHAHNGWYLSDVLVEGNYSFVGLFLIKSEFVYQNQFLSNLFNNRLFDNEIDTKISLERKKYNVLSANGDFLFSLDFSQTQAISLFQENILFILYLICFLLIISCFWLCLLPYIKNVHYVVQFSLFLIFICLFRYTLFYFRFPSIIYSLEIFSPKHFASSAFLPSLGDLIQNVLCLFIFSYFIFKELTIDKVANKNKISRALIVFLVIPVLLVLFYFLSESFEVIIINSNIYFLFNNFFELTIYSFWSVFVFCLLLLSVFYLINGLFTVFLLVFEKNIFHILLMAASLIACILATVLFRLKFDIYVFIVQVLFIVVILYQNKKALNPNKITTIIIIILFFAAFSTYFIYKFSEIKEKESRKITAANLASETDPIAEYLFSEIQDDILQDTILQKYLENHIESEKHISKYLRDKYFSGYWSKFDMQVTVCSDEDKLVIKPDNIQVLCKDLFKDIKDSSGRETIVKNFYQINQSSGRSSYLAELPFVSSKDSINKTIYVELFSKFIPNQLGYPDLLIDKSVKINKSLSNYNYARYINKELIMQYGKYAYYISSKGYDNVNKDMYYFNLNGYSHLYYKVDEKSELIISKKDTALMDIFATFSYLFIIYFVIWLLFKLILFSPVVFKDDSFNFSNRVRIAMVFIVVISFISIGIVTLKFIINIYNNKNYDNISEKAHSILIEMENKLSKIETFTPELKEYATELLIDFSDVYFTDINLYDLKGNLIATSREKIFSEGLISRKMNTKAYHQMISFNKTFYIHEENIGSLKYLSAYIPFRNDKNKCLAYINLPYFAKQSEQRMEISNFLAAFINIYVFLIAFSIIIAVLISRYITKPLQLIKEKLSRFQLGKVNEKIVWRKNDEIGSLVNEYNRLIDELAKSVELLSQSERESAWREMAKQVAHEIKNPLTPMKLSVQHLQRTWKDKPEEWEAKLEKFTSMMIAQIDTLSSIASSFSDFTKMPAAQNSVLDLHDVVVKTIDIYRDITSARLIMQIPAQGRFLVIADEMQLRRAFDNIIKNSLQAIKEEENGIIIINIEENNNNYIVSFKDNGNGISEEEAKKIFLPNFTTKTSGMGLGLAIVKNIIEGFGGQVSFESEYGRGATFFITLPVYKDER